MFLKEITEQLKAHAARFDLENRAVQGCRQNLINLLEEDPEGTQFYLRGLNIDELKFQFVKHQLVLDDAVRSWPRILSRVTFGIEDRIFIDNINSFGYYDLETTEDGEVSDDWFWWEQMRDEEGKLAEFSRF